MIFFLIRFKTESPNSAFAKHLRLLRVDLFLLVSLPPGIGAMLALEVTCRFGVQAGIRSH